MKKILALATSLAIASFGSAFAADKYVLDSSHSQVVFSWNHLGFSSTTGMFSGFEGVLMLDEASPENSSVDVSIKSDTIWSGWGARDDHLKTDAFFDPEHPLVSFKSTSVKQTGEKTADIMGDLTINGVTTPVTLKATLNKQGNHPMAGKPAVGFDATTTLTRSTFGMDLAVPHVSDEVELRISVEAVKAD